MKRKHGSVRLPASGGKRYLSTAVRVPHRVIQNIQKDPLQGIPVTAHDLREPLAHPEIQLQLRLPAPVRRFPADFPAEIREHKLRLLVFSLVIVQLRRMEQAVDHAEHDARRLADFLHRVLLPVVESTRFDLRQKRQHRLGWPAEISLHAHQKLPPSLLRFFCLLLRGLHLPLQRGNGRLRLLLLSGKRVPLPAKPPDRCIPVRLQPGILPVCLLLRRAERCLRRLCLLLLLRRERSRLLREPALLFLLRCGSNFVSL